MVRCSLKAFAAALATLCGLLPEVQATSDIPPALIQDLRDGQTEALLAFLRGKPKDASVIQQVHDAVKEAVEKKKDDKKVENKKKADGLEGINNMLRSQIEGTFKDAQKSIDREVDSFVQCETARRKKIVLAKANKTFYEEKSKQHKACRINEKEWLTKSKKCEDIIKAQQKLHDASLKHMQAFEGEQELIQCERSFNESDFAYAKRLRNKFATDRAKFLPVKAKHEKNGKQLEHFTEQCKAVYKMFYKIAKKCHTNAVQMDHAACYYASHSQEACDGFKECQPLYYASWEEAKASAEKVVKNHKKKWLLTGSTDCLVKLLAAERKVTKKEIKDCDDCSRGHCAEWVTRLDYKEGKLSKEFKCKIPEEFPCNEAYYKKEYGDLPKGIEVTCQPCLGIRKAEKKANKKEDKKDDKKKDEKKKAR